MPQLNLPATYPFQLFVHRADGTQIYVGSFTAGEVRTDTFTDAANGASLQVVSDYPYNSPVGKPVSIVKVTGPAGPTDYIFRFVPSGVVLSSDLLGAFINPQTAVATVRAFVNFAARATQYVDAKPSDFINGYASGADLSALPTPSEVSVVVGVTTSSTSIVPVLGAYALIDAEVHLGNAVFWTDTVGCYE